MTSVIACGGVIPSASSILNSQQVKVETSNKKNKINYDMTLVKSRHASPSISGFFTNAVSPKYMVKYVAMKQVFFDYLSLRLSAFL